MAPSYKNADSTILALIEALILNYVQQVPAFYNTNNNLSLLEPMIWLAIKIMVESAAQEHAVGRVDEAPCVVLNWVWVKGLEQVYL